MVFDERFSAGAFERATPEQRQALALELEEEINEELHRAIMPAFEGIVEALAEFGHDLRLYEPPVPGDISCRDDATVNGQYECRLRVGVDVVVSVGYRDTGGNPEEVCVEVNASVRNDGTT